MKILVLGAGVVGTAAAYYLAKDGHEVTVIERHEAAARGTSQSNAGLVSPGDATAWASPAALKTFLRALWNHDLGIKVRLRLDPYFYLWSLRFLRECTVKRLRANTDIKLRLALHSRACINELSEATGIDYDERKKGILYFFRSQKSLDTGTDNYRYLAEHGLPIEIVGRERLVELEPGLAGVKEKIAGGIYSPIDQTGDSKQFTDNLAAYAAEKLGVKFLFGTTVEGLDIEGDRVRAVMTSAGPVTDDAVVISMGPESGLLGRRYGIDLPVYPVKGYTATIPLEDESKGPTMGGADEDRLIGYSRLGNRLRMSSTAEFTGFDRSFKPRDFRTILETGKDLFPGAFDEKKAVLWAGLRPMMPNSVPVIGQAKYRNLYLDTGHGHVGWTMACGSGQFLADVVAGRKPQIDPRGLLYGTGR
ncbi:D-amino acid dehydrogenase [Mesorhizobium sp. M2D.F.Ca.ET.185.01.1.1]|uniref:D-amino acid dehydrogenase n=1 Tax=unclassified Mesorhizobium TaxID=325217 RepID=UPI000FCA9BF7|nr:MULTISPECIES: D-amino acid dehydrogenase [unclassified Mesorhizobium]TGP73399.1 D-amino acid dehydrogenase [bacterium M00.F.Ca.ET.227.01.1.1]TGP84411.1 D-amino acid dehydrogenase [bacterium M00.F.Ca.ET.221.01.1.1]TGP87025.1 D-amino acid dehydrogenase [bacterium M00.F.Ca.ET.222.01.1.1]TGT97310.1 D-amino acid dehydrogenase [bacterium M00.F.Ca.ET.163.01.1.1]TGU22482.1 D-amino acid dehydrogenase [bacterium M00.F.Ca.ET.156.01.1.1]TGU43184.1 D-amino acid dehydrogenase [bacterium M00.F.Ca.ET.146.